MRTHLISTKVAELPAVRELQERPQWVAWRYKEVTDSDGTKKATKPPVNPKIGGGASHSDPNTWGTYAQARVFAMSRKMAGVGFVLTEDDGYTGIDLDKVRDPATGALDPWAAEIVAMAETYTEVSPSGAGLRLIARGKIPATVKCDPAHVEIYRSQRYLTITGDHVPDTPTTIEPAPRTIEALMARVAERQPKAEPASASESEPAKHARAPLNFVKRERAAGAANHAGARPKRDFWANLRDATMNDVSWFTALFPAATYQPGTGGWRVQSKYLGRSLQEDISITPGAATGGIVDFGVADMGDRRLGKRTAVDLVMEWGGKSDPVEAARWLCDQICLTMESLGWNERTQSEDVQPTQEARVDDDGTVYDSETGEVLHRAEKSAADSNELPDRLTKPAGLLGDIVNWIENSAQRPNRVLALGAAITVAGTLMGRRVAGPTTSGTHLYVVMLAPSGSGKDHPLRRAAALLREADPALVGPGEFMSQTALARHVGENPLSLSPLDEFGALVARVCSPKAGGWEKGLVKILREYWGGSFETIPGTQWASLKTEPIIWPALSVLGVSTHDEFFSALSSREATNGFLNRFLLLSTTARVVDIDEPAANRFQIPPSIKSQIRNLYADCAGGSKTSVIVDGATVRDAGDRSLFNEQGQITIGWADEQTRASYRDLVKEALSKSDDGAGELWARTAEMAIRLATIHAVSRAGLEARLGAEDFAWGHELACWSANTMAREAGLRMSDTPAQANAKLILRHITEAGGSLKHRDLNRRLAHRLRQMDLKDALTALTESGAIRQLVTQPQKGGPKTVSYIKNAG